MVWGKRLMLFLAVGAVIGGVIFAFLPQPIRIDVEAVQLGPMEVAVRDDGKTRLKERYVISTPISGRLQRIEFKVGDPVVAGETVIARMEPTAPELLDPRELARVQARVKASEGRLARARSDLAESKAERDQAQNDLERFQHLNKAGAATDSQLEQAQLAFRTKTEGVKSAGHAVEIAEFELELEQAALLHLTREGVEADPEYEFLITSPITGRVLRLMQESSAVLAAGAPLMEVGDPTDLEVVVDVLSGDAVRIRSGQRALLEHWGGGAPLHGVVRLVEPSGFTKISALGVEEQRVNVIVDFTDSLSERLYLGDGFRVEARIIVWEENETMTVPTGALFRAGDHWAVFVARDGRAHLRNVAVGENNGLRVQILDGLETGDQVIIHPSDQITDGVRVLPRSA